MHKRPNTRPTHIYLLLDLRPETLTGGWPSGEPFYCGKTVESVETRFKRHLRAARTKTKSKQPCLVRIRECRGFVGVVLVQIVPASDCWREVERRWIAFCRAAYPRMTNVSAGGYGPVGMVHSEASRRLISEALKGKRLSPEVRAMLLKCVTNRKKTSEEIEKLRRAALGRRHSEEAKRKIAAFHTGKPRPPEVRAKIQIGNAKRPMTEKRLADLAKARSCRKFSRRTAVEKYPPKRSEVVAHKPFSVQDEVITRDKVCLHCSSAGTLYAQYKKFPFECVPGENPDTLENLIALCAPCFSRAESKANSRTGRAAA